MARLGQGGDVKIIIVGAGEIGWYLAEVLIKEHHELVVVEVDPARTQFISAQLDVQVICGSGSSPQTLVNAGIDSADMMCCVTQNDEVNLISALLAREHGVRHTVVRIQSDELRDSAGAKLLRTVGADLVIDPDAETADEILELVHSPGVDEVYPMPVGNLVVIGADVTESSPLVDKTLSQISRDHAATEFLVGAITRNKESSIPNGDVQILAGDHVRILTTNPNRGRVIDLLGVGHKNARRVMVLGGGDIGSRVAERLQNEGVDVIVIERDADRAVQLSDRLHKIVVLQGEITDTDLLAHEGIDEMDAVIAATGEDAANALACTFAASEGASFTVAVLHSLKLLPMIHELGIDAALSPRTASANAVLGLVRGGTAAVATFLESDIEVDEFKIESGCTADGCLVSDLALPEKVLLGAVIRADGSSEICSGNTQLFAGNHLVVFAEPDPLAEARALFSR